MSIGRGQIQVLFSKKSSTEQPSNEARRGNMEMSGEEMPNSHLEIACGDI